MIHFRTLGGCLNRRFCGICLGSEHVLFHDFALVSLHSTRGRIVGVFWECLLYLGIYTGVRVKWQAAWDAFEGTSQYFK